MDPISGETLATVAGSAAFVALGLQFFIKPILKTVEDRYIPILVNLSGLALGAVGVFLAGVVTGVTGSAAWINLGLTGLVGAATATKGYELLKNAGRALKDGP